MKGVNVPLFEEHTGQNLVDVIQDILANWELKAESLVTTTVNGSNCFAISASGIPRLSLGPISTLPNPCSLTEFIEQSPDVTAWWKLSVEA